MQVEEIYKKLHRFVVEATKLKNEKVIFANQNALTRPKKPYASIAVSAFKNTGMADKKMNDLGEVTVILPIRFVVGFQAFADNFYQAEEYLNSLFTAFSTELPSKIFNGTLAMMKVLKPVSAIPTIFSEQVEHKAILELEMSYMKLTNYFVGFIETVEIEDLTNNQKFRIGETI